VAGQASSALSGQDVGPCGEDIVAFLDWVDWTGISLVVLLVIGFGLVWLRFRNRD
jgi:hypothetical protein